MKRANPFVMLLLLGIVLMIAVVAILQRPLDWALVLGATGFLLFTLSWIGMYFRLSREVPDHQLVSASYLNLPLVGRTAGARNLVKLVGFHFTRHRLDLCGALLIAAVALVAGAVILSLTGAR
jgi:hypothetical protein